MQSSQVVNGDNPPLGCGFLFIPYTYLWSPWQRQDCLKPAARAVAQQEVATVHLCNVTCNAQAQTGAAGIAATGTFQSIKRFEYPFKFSFWNALALIQNTNLQLFVVIVHDDGGAFSVFDGVIDQITQASLHGRRLARIGLCRGALQPDFLANFRRICLEAFQQCYDVNGLHLLRIVHAAHEIQGGGHHGLHFFQVFCELCSKFVVLQ